MTGSSPSKINHEYPKDKSEEVDAINNQKTTRRSRKVPFSGELLIDKNDFMENPKKYFRLAPGREYA